MMVENILMEAVKRGGDRQSLHEKLRKYSMLAGKSVKEEGRANDLIERILSDEDFSFIKDDLDSITDTKLYIGCAEKQVEEFLSGEVKTVLAAFDDMESISAELKV